MDAKEIWILTGRLKGLGSSLVKKVNFRSNVVKLVFCFLVTPALIASAQNSTQRQEWVSPASIALISGREASQEGTSKPNKAINIKDELRNERLKEVLCGIINLKQGKVGEIIGKFSGTNPNWIWKVEEGSLPIYTNAVTKPMDSSVLTILDFRKLKRASKLSVARTIIHEMVHAYLVLYFRNSATAFKEYPEIAEAWRTSSTTA